MELPQASGQVLDACGLGRIKIVHCAPIAWADCPLVSAIVQQWYAMQISFLRPLSAPSRRVSAGEQALAVDGWILVRSLAGHLPGMACWK